MRKPLRSLLTANPWLRPIDGRADADQRGIARLPWQSFGAGCARPSSTMAPISTAPTAAFISSQRTPAAFQTAMANGAAAAAPMNVRRCIGSSYLFCRHCTELAVTMRSPVQATDPSELRRPPDCKPLLPGASSTSWLPGVSADLGDPCPTGFRRRS